MSDLAASRDFYVEHLSFGLDFVFREPAFYMGLVRDKLEMHLIDEQPPNARQPAGGGYLNILTGEVDNLYQLLIAAGVKMLVSVGDREYGLRDFMIGDPDGNVLIFGTPIKG